MKYNINDNQKNIEISSEDIFKLNIINEIKYNIIPVKKQSKQTNWMHLTQ